MLLRRNLLARLGLWHYPYRKTGPCAMLEMFWKSVSRPMFDSESTSFARRPSAAEGLLVLALLASEAKLTCHLFAVLTVAGRLSPSRRQ